MAEHYRSQEAKVHQMHNLVKQFEHNDYSTNTSSETRWIDHAYGKKLLSSEKTL